MALLDLNTLKAALPDNIRKTVTDEVLHGINAAVADPQFYEYYRNNLLSYGHVLKEGKFTVKQYSAAVRYVSYKLMGLTNQEAWMKTFPDKYAYFAQKGTSAKDISSYVHAYHNTKLVNLVMEQSLVPVHVVGRDLFWKALNVQAELMVSATSEKVRSDAANSVLNTLRPPETKKMELDINHKDDGTLEALRAATQQLVDQQANAIATGLHTAGQVAAYRVIEAEKLDE
ncbi:hypothetical protein L7B14_004234 [Salmonella enterica]|nr:hypothetical protein [Salmonella enterica]